MNVAGTNEFSQEVFCEWFAGDHLQKGQFHFTAVELVPSSPQKTEIGDSDDESPQDDVSTEQPPGRESRVGYMLGGIALLIVTAFFFFVDISAGKPEDPVMVRTLIGLVGGLYTVIWAASSRH